MKCLFLADIQSLRLQCCRNSETNSVGSSLSNESNSPKISPADTTQPLTNHIQDYSTNLYSTWANAADNNVSFFTNASNPSRYSPPANSGCYGLNGELAYSAQQKMRRSLSLTPPTAPSPSSHFENGIGTFAPLNGHINDISPPSDPLHANSSARSQRSK